VVIIRLIILPTATHNLDRCPVHQELRILCTPGLKYHVVIKIGTEVNFITRSCGMWRRVIWYRHQRFGRTCWLFLSSSSTHTDVNILSWSSFYCMNWLRKLEMMLKGVTTGTGIVRRENTNAVHVTGKFVCSLSRSPARVTTLISKKPLYRPRYTEHLAWIWMFAASRRLIL
jgi:hypothetical protein